MKYLEYYKKAMKTGKLLSKDPNGLCYEEGFNLSLFYPTPDDRHKYNLGAYWASEVDCYQYYLPNGRERSKSEFGPTRQNIVLFLACINDEL